MSKIPEKQRALKVRGAGQVELAECPVPQPQSDELLVRVKQVALNPVVSSHVKAVSLPSFLALEPWPGPIPCFIVSATISSSRYLNEMLT
jgi:NADPH:quinone reductase-like Zn-dependent oxidoreductase